MKFKSYENKAFIIEDNDARIRCDDDLSAFAVFTAGEALPPSAQVGNFKLIPKRTEVRVTGVRTDAKRTVFALVQPVNAAPGTPAGWMKASNLGGGLLNETTGLAPDNLALPPLDNNFTVTDKQAIIRGGPSNFTSTGRSIAPGTFVLVTQKSKDTTPPGKFVKVGHGFLHNGQPQADEEIGWTAADNLTCGWSSFFLEPSWLDEKGPNACWERGQFIGPKLLVNLVGAGGELKQITLASLEPYFRLVEAAAKKNLVLAVESGFRTFQKQAELFEAFQNGTGNLAARPGRSNHQHGQAFDLNTRGFDGDPLYDWLKKNGPRLGFIRTVNKEHWHWEYRPAQAAELAAAGKFKLASVAR